jgi:peptide deformylase
MNQIVTIPHPALTKPAKQITRFDRQLRRVIERMKTALKTANNPKGVGLAAPQIGLSLCIFIIRPKETVPIRVFINPEILKSEAVDETPEKKDKLEGCLSIPKVWGSVNRAQKVTLKYQDESGAEHIEEFTGFPAIIIQHETDHTNGILFTRRVAEQNGKFYEPKKDNKGKEYLEEIVI